jgi:hypothetical protein
VSTRPTEDDVRRVGVRNSIGEVLVIWRRQLFSDSIRELRPAGMTVAESSFPLMDCPRRLHYDGIVLIGDDEVPREMWDRVRPKPSCEALPIDLHLFLPPMRGNNSAALAATIAVTVAALAISGGALGGLGLAVANESGGLSTLFLGGSPEAIVLGMAVPVGGSVAIAAGESINSPGR